MSKMPSIVTDQVLRAAKIVGATLAFLVAVESAAAVSHAMHWHPLPATIAGQVAILTVALLFITLDGEGFRSIGVTAPWKAYDAGVIPGIIAVHFSGSLLAAWIMMSMGIDIRATGRSAGLLLSSFSNYSPGTFLLLALVATVLAGIGEEILFRGYLITRLERMGFPAWICIAASAFLFGLAHWPGYGFWPAMSKGIFFGIPTGIFFWYRRSLGPLMVAHTLMDYASFVLVFAAAKLVPGM